MTTRTRARFALNLAALLLAALTAAGCSDDDPTSPAAAANGTAVEDGGLRLEISTDKASYGFGETVTINVTLTNVSGAPVDLDFTRGDPARYTNLNINVDDGSGAAHHVAGEGERDQTTLAAGSSLRSSFAWDQGSRFTRGRPVDRGVYEVIGFSSFDDRGALKVAGLYIELN